jgi:squalene synthase HpnC
MSIARPLISCLPALQQFGRAAAGAHRGQCALRTHPMSVDHYENFPVASLLCPARLRPAVAAIYWFARTADDLADEGDAPVSQRLADFSAYRQDLAAAAQGGSVSPRWPAVFTPLAQAIRQFRLPLHLLTDLLSAFEQDLVKQRYADRSELLDYCRRSANPVGRLMLHLYGVNEARALTQSDAICTALQLANFWQDLSIDTQRSRLYIPLSDLALCGTDPDTVLADIESAGLRAAVKEMVCWTRTLMAEGAPLVHSVRQQAGWRVGCELSLVVQGGLRILEKIEQMDFQTLHQRPRLRAFDAPVLLWRGLRMRSAPEGAWKGAS